MKYVYIDFEYNHPEEYFPELVCASWKLSDCPTTFNCWLYRDQNQKVQLQELLLEYQKQGYTFCSYAVTAEARCFDALGLDPTDFDWVDLYLEWRQVRNCNDEYSYGVYYLGNMKMKSVPPHLNPKRNEGKNNMQLFFGMQDCCVRLLNIKPDFYLKKGMRDLILTAPDTFTKEEQSDIMEYCDSDIQYLPQIHQMMTDILFKLLGWNRPRIIRAQLKRGEFSAHVALMESTGIPLDMSAIQNLRKNIELAKDKLISNLVDNYYPFFTKSKKRKRDLLGTWRDTYKKFDEFLVNCDQIDHKLWKRTESGRYVNDDDYLKKFEGIPEIKEYREVRKILGQLRWLREPKENETDLFDSIGKDGRLRTFFGIYGTQTARNAPAARRFIFAMSAWLRCLIRAPKGYTITEIDYASQEFAIAAILSGDKNMIEAYKSGDPYMYFAKHSHAIKKGMSKAEIKEVRNLFKETKLGIQYGMGVKSLAIKLTSDTGRKVTEREAEKQIDRHKRLYPIYWRWLKRIDREYARQNYLTLPCDWVLLGDNPHTLSVRNFPTQGTGSSIIREAVKRCKEHEITVISTLHDSIYILSKDDDVDFEVGLASGCMVSSFNKILVDKVLEIRLDITSHKSDEPWISEKGSRFYEILKEYLKPQVTGVDLKKKLLETVYS